jgi:hypothetical protein
VGFYSGVFNTTYNPDELNKRSFASALLRLFPDGAAPIFALTSQTGRSKAVSSTHGYFTKTLTFASVESDAAGNLAAVTNLVVVDSSQITENMVLFNPATQENMRVTAVPDATHVTVTRAFGRVAAANIAGSQVLIVIGTAFPEGSARPTARGLTTVYISNFTQIFRNAWAVTDTARASLTEMGFTNIAESRKDGALLHSVDIESAILFGQAEMDTTGAQPLHATQGIVDAVEQYAPANTNTAAATTNLTQLVGFLEPAWTYSHDLGDSKQRVAFVGSTAMKVLNDIARLNGQVQMMQGQTGAFGMSFNKFLFYKGAVNLIEHPILNGLSGMAGLMIVVDMPALKLAYMDGRDTRPEEFGGTGRNNANGVDSQGGSFTTEFAVELLNPAGCDIIYGLTAGAAG